MGRRRSTRDKIKYEADKLPDDIDQITGRLERIFELSQGRQPAVNQAMPMMVTYLEELKKVFEAFRRRL